MSHSDMNVGFHPTPVNLSFSEATDADGDRYQIVEIASPFGCVRLMLAREEALNFWNTGLAAAKKISALTVAPAIDLSKLNGKSPFFKGSPAGDDRFA